MINPATETESTIDHGAISKGVIALITEMIALISERMPLIIGVMIGSVASPTPTAHACISAPKLHRMIATVKPIFAAKCAPCHTSGGSGGHNIGTSYSDTQLNSYYCPGKKKGECALVRIQDLTMPPGGGGNVNASEQAIIQAWISGGMQP